MTRFFISGLFLVLLGFQFSLWAFGKKPQEPTIKELHQAPLQVVVERIPLVLDTYLWRDFMPGGEPEGRGLQGVIHLQNPEGNILPEGLEIRRVWVLRDEEVWKTTATESSPGSTPKRLERIIRNGPRWQPGSEVTVVVEIQDKDGSIYLLRAEKQFIQRTM